MRATKDFFEQLRKDIVESFAQSSPVINEKVDQGIVDLFAKCKVIDINNPLIIELINALGVKFSNAISFERYVNENNEENSPIEVDLFATKDEFITDLKERIKQLENQNVELNEALNSVSIINREDNSNISITRIKESVLEYSKQFDNMESLKRFLQDINDVLRGTAWDSYYSEVRNEAFAELQNSKRATMYKIDHVGSLAPNASTVTNNHYKDNNG